jgi:hypothetical protein
MVIHSDSRSGLNGHPHSFSNGNVASRPTSGTTATFESQAEFPIAIVGMSCRFAGDATSPSKLWDLCLAGKDSWSPIPEDRFTLKSWYDENPLKVGRVSHIVPYAKETHAILLQFILLFILFQTSTAVLTVPNSRLTSRAVIF